MPTKRPAYSLIFAFIIMTLIMVIATTSIQDTRAKLQLFRDLEASSQARLAAESAAELGIVALKDSTYTAETEEDAFCLRQDSTSDCTSEANFTVYPYATENENSSDSFSDGYYFLPIPGTGNAAPTEDCSILEEDKDADHSCNWNKLVPGESVTIPMYYDDGAGNLYFPDSMGLTAWYLRLRTPCDNGSIAEDCDGGDRYVINTKGASDYYQLSDNPSIVLWEFVGETSSGSLSIIPNDALLTASNRSPYSNTEIYEGLISSNFYSLVYGIDNIVLPALASSTFTGFDSIYDFITTSGYTDLYFSMNINNVLEDTSGDTIPYLEYQIVVDSSTYPIVANTAEIVGKGYYDTGEYTYFFPYTISSSNTGTTTTLYTLSN